MLQNDILPKQYWLDCGTSVHVTQRLLEVVGLTAVSSSRVSETSQYRWSLTGYVFVNFSIGLERY
jgi:hypothetical protein